MVKVVRETVYGAVRGCGPLKAKVNVSTFVIAGNLLLKRSGTATGCQGISQFYLHTHAFIHGRNEPYLPLPSQPKLVLIYRPRRDGRLSWPGQPERWVNSRPRTATQCLSRLLTGQSITPHWASTCRCTQPAQRCCPEWQKTELNRDLLSFKSNTLTTTPPSHLWYCKSKILHKYWLMLKAGPRATLHNFGALPFDIDRG